MANKHLITSYLHRNNSTPPIFSVLLAYSVTFLTRPVCYRATELRIDDRMRGQVGTHGDDADPGTPSSPTPHTTLNDDIEAAGARPLCQDRQAGPKQQPVLVLQCLRKLYVPCLFVSVVTAVVFFPLLLVTDNPVSHLLDERVARRIGPQLVGSLIDKVRARTFSCSSSTRQRLPKSYLFAYLPVLF